MRAYGAEIKQAIARLQRHRIDALTAIPMVFTMDDIPMWYVWGKDERLEAYGRYTDVIADEGVSPVFFVNPGYLRYEDEWPVLAEWLARGWTIANHGANHRYIGQAGLDAVIADRHEAERLFTSRLSGWGAAPRFYRFPNSDWGNDREMSCRNTWDAGYSILPVTLGIDDFRFSELYHSVSTASIQGRQSPEALAIAELFFEAQAQLFAEMKARRVRLRTPDDQPEVFIIHSTRFARDWLPEIFAWYKARGVRWVSPSTADAVFSPQAHSCVPSCKWDGSCR